MFHIAKQWGRANLQNAQAGKTSGDHYQSQVAWVLAAALPVALRISRIPVHAGGAQSRVGGRDFFKDASTG
jgi:hypothetical protein